jgi:hypothetical protein
MKHVNPLIALLGICSGCVVHASARIPEPPPPPPIEASVTVGGEAPAPDAPAAPAEVQTDSYDDQDPTALQDFHPALDAHGSWVDDPNYGTIWVPNAGEVGADFTPYVGAGHWVYGDDYLWVSDYDWGWAPFHYGRWVAMDGRWGWIPGREYAPAWVSWRTGEPGYAYVGWAPAPPAYIWRGGVAITVGFSPPAPRFVFCAHGDLFSPAPARAVIVGPRAVEIQGHTSVFASASVGGGGGGHFGHGPPPTSIGIPAGKIAHPTGKEPGIAQAQGFSRPSTAARLGGHPPARQVAARSTSTTQPRADAARTQPGREPVRENQPQGQRGEPARTTTTTTTDRTTTTSEPARTEPGRTSEAVRNNGPAETTRTDATRAQPGRQPAQTAPQPRTATPVKKKK